MSQLLHIFWRVIVIGFALMVAVLATALVTFVAVLPSGEELRQTYTAQETFGRFLLVGVAGTYVIGALAGPATAGAIILAELLRIRNWMYYAAAGAVAGAAGIASWDASKYTQQEIAIVLAAGIAGGLAYWLIAGRGAGIVYEPPKPPAGLPPAPQPTVNRASAPPEA